MTVNGSFQSDYQTSTRPVQGNTHQGQCKGEVIFTVAPVVITGHEVSKLICLGLKVFSVSHKIKKKKCNM